MSGRRATYSFIYIKYITAYLIRRKSDDNERTCPLKTMDPAVIRTLFYFVSARSQKDVSGEDSPKEWIVFFFCVIFVGF